jgi:hypothetical protein
LADPFVPLRRGKHDQSFACLQGSQELSVPEEICGIIVREGGVERMVYESYPSRGVRNQSVVDCPQKRSVYVGIAQYAVVVLQGQQMSQYKGPTATMVPLQIRHLVHIIQIYFGYGHCFLLTRALDVLFMTYRKN